MSGVSTTATSFGGAVRTAARPNKIGCAANDADGTDETGVPVRGDGLTGVIGLFGSVVLSESRLLSPLIEGESGALDPDGILSVMRRWGVEREDVERMRTGDTPERAVGGLPEPGVSGD